MANKKISQLDPIGTIDVNQDSIPIVDYSENVTKRTNLANIGQRVLEASTTTNLAEGSNLYFTNTRVYTKVKASLLAGSNTSITFDDALQTITIASQGNVQSVNTKTGAVVLTTTDISEGTNEYHTSARVRAVILTGLSTATNAIISATDSVLSAFGKLQAQITANLSTLTSHTSNTSNPHSVTKAQVGLSNVDNTSDANKPISTATQTALDGKVDENAAITGATKTKITYDAKGLVTVGADATTADIADSTNRRYITDAQLVVVQNTSGTNTGDQTLSGLGGVPTSRTLTINGTTQDLSADRTFTIATGITIGTTPITSGTIGRVLFEGTGNVVSESANLFWDNTNGKLGVGTSSPSAIIHSVGSVTASSLIARGAFLNNTLVASANNDVLVGLDINPTFTNGAFTGLQNTGLRIFGSTAGNAPTLEIRQTSNTAPTWLSIRNTSSLGSVGAIAADLGISGGSNQFFTGTAQGDVAFKAYSQANSSKFFIGATSASTANLILFSSGNVGVNTTTDAGFRLDVNGTAKINDNLSVFGNVALTKTNAFFALSNGATWSMGSNTSSIYSIGSFTVSTNNGLCLRVASDAFGGGNAFPVGSLAIGTATNVASSLLTCESTTKGFLPPRMTTTQKNAIASPATGLMVYDTTLNVITYYNGTTWV